MIKIENVGVSKLRIALDAMGGDYAPLETVKGAIEAINENKKITVILVGKEELIKKELSKYDYDKDRIEIKHASEVIEMDEKDAPTTVVRAKKDASMNVALQMIKDKEAMACISAGNTGALMTASQLKLKRIKGVLRPAITTVFPANDNKHIVLLDAGANADCKPEYLDQFATMANEYAKVLLEVEKPKVGLLNIGEEDGKGNELTKAAFYLLKENPNIDFYGNIETREMTNGDVDVVVTDGFTGNIVLKTAEGTAHFMKNIIKDEVNKSLIAKIGALLMSSVFKEMKKRSDSSEYGGALFMGLNGISIKAHGNSDSKAIKNAISVGNKFAENNFIEGLTKVIGGQNENN
jgi:glycerol-3-phosphate acyltransferase PlsX